VSCFSDNGNLGFQARRNGNTGDAPCALSGSVYVPTIRSNELAQYEAAWPGVVTYGNLITQYAVAFVNWDGSPVLDASGNAYIQYVDAAGSAYDPVTAGEIDAPTRETDAQYIYTYTGWDELPVGVIESHIGNTAVKATYSRTARTFTVQWYDGIGAGDGTLLEQKTGIVYGACVKPDNELPGCTSLEGTNIYYVPLGWDANTGFITGDTKVHMTWVIGNLPSISLDLSLAEMTWAQRYAVAKNAMCDSDDGGYWDRGETMDFVMGHDFDFDSGTPGDPGYVASKTLISEPTYFDGTSPMIFNGENDLPLIQLFNGSFDRFTLVVDYEYCSDAGSLVSCFSDNGNLGFQARRNGNYVNVLWGDTNANIGYKYQRGIMVIRYNRGQYPLVLYISSDGNTMDAEYAYSSASPETSVINTARARTQSPDTDAPLTFGGIGYIDGSDVTSLRATGWIYWAKLWYDDLGTYNAAKLVSFPHINARYIFTGIRYRDGLDSTTLVSAGFFHAGLLPLRGRINISNTNAGGWPDTLRRAWLNGQYFDALPFPLQYMIKQARVRSTAGGGSSSSPSLNIVPCMDLVTLPCYAELFSSITGSSETNIAYLDECDDLQRRIPTFVLDSSRGMTSQNNSRVQFCGIILDDDVQFIVGGGDPTTPGLNYAVEHMKTVWIDSNNNGHGYLFVSADYASKHKYIGGRLTSSADNLDTVGTDEDGNPIGKWISACNWWSRSPYALYSTNFWYVYTNGSGYPNPAGSTYGLAPFFSI